MERSDWIAVALVAWIAWALPGCLLGDEPTTPLKIRNDQFCEQGIGAARAAYAEARGLIAVACVEAQRVQAVRDACEGARDASVGVAWALNRNDCPLVRDGLASINAALQSAALARRFSERLAEAVRAERVAAEQD